MKGLLVAVLAFCAVQAQAARRSAAAPQGRDAAACLEQRDLDSGGFVIRFLEHPDDARRPRRLTLRFAPGRCSSLESRAPRALRVFPGDDYDLVVTTPEGSARSAVQLRRHDGSLAAYLGRLPNDWLADGEPIDLGARWLLAPRGRTVAYGTVELTPLPAVPDALAQADR